MRSADMITLFRTLLVFPIAYAILAKLNPFLILVAIIVMFVLDAVDGWAGLRDVSRGKIDFVTYLRASLFGDKTAKGLVSKFKPLMKKDSIYGARIDIAGDRITEYVLWIVFTYLNIVPLFVLFLIVLRHSFVDAVMGARGTSSKLKSRFAQVVYGSSLGRGGIGVVKVVTFSYLVFVYISGWPITIGYALVAILTAYILLRGVAELYETFYA